VLGGVFVSADVAIQKALRGWASAIVFQESKRRQNKVLGMPKDKLLL
jgi:hypothetical protein